MKPAKQTGEPVLIAVDLETTGLHPSEDHILEIGAVKYAGGQETVFQSLIRQQQPLPEFITDLTHITDSMVQSARPFEEVFTQFDAFLGEEAFVLIAHNIRFDFAFLQVSAMRLKKRGIVMENWFRRPIRGVDTLFLARKLRRDLSRHNLACMLAAYGLTNETPHRAAADARACYELYRCMEQQLKGEVPDAFCPKQLGYREKKHSPATAKQKKDLQELLKYHKMDLSVLERKSPTAGEETSNGRREPLTWDTLTKSEASRLIEKLRVPAGNCRRKQKKGRKGQSMKL